MHRQGLLVNLTKRVSKVCFPKIIVKYHLVTMVNSYEIKLYRKNNDFEALNSVIEGASGDNISVKFESDHSDSSTCFSAQNFFSSLKTGEQTEAAKSPLGYTLLSMNSIHSTQNLLQYDLPQLPIGTVAVAGIQNTGKGRGKNVWESPTGNLAFTAKIKVSGNKNIVFLQYLVSLDILRAVENIVSKHNGKRDILKLKWPNDIYANNLKIGGILCSVEQSMDKNDDGYFVYCGVGLNISHPGPSICLDQIYPDLKAANVFTKENILSEFCNIFQESIQQFSKEGFQPFIEQYYTKWLHSNQEVKISSDNSIVKIKGLTKDGYLLAFDEKVQEWALHPDFNSLDLFHGLIKKKI